MTVPSFEWLNIVMVFTERKKEESKYRSNKEYNMSMIKMTVWWKESFSRDIEMNLRFGWFIALVCRNETANQNSSILPCSRCTEQWSAGRRRDGRCSFILTFEWHLVLVGHRKKKKTARTPTEMNSSRDKPNIRPCQITKHLAWIEKTLYPVISLHYYLFWNSRLLSHTTSMRDTYGELCTHARMYYTLLASHLWPVSWTVVMLLYPKRQTFYHRHDYHHKLNHYDGFL